MSEFNTSINNTSANNAPVNYAGIYARIPEENMKARYSAFFDNIRANENDAELKILKNKVNKAEKVLADLRLELEARFSGKFEENCSPANINYYVNYNSSRSSDNYCYLLTGERITSIAGFEDYQEITLSTKSNEVYVVAGYLYELGAVLVKNYALKVSQDNSFLKVTLLDTIIINMFKGWSYSSNDSWYSSFSILNKINICGDDFVSNFFNVKVETGMTLHEYYYAFTRNKSYEIIIRTAPSDVIPTLLRDYTSEEACPIHKLLGIEKASYNLAVQHNVLKQYMSVLKYIKNKNHFHYTDSEWVDFLEESKGWADHLITCQVDVGVYWGMGNVSEDNLLSYLCRFYEDEGMYQYYSFMKWCHYLIDDIVEDGFATIKEFVYTLRDYIRMCEGIGATPMYYTQNLQKAHNVCRRNMKIKATEHEEEIFGNRYKDDKVVECGDGYVVVPPKTTQDVVQEGNKLSHCVASYVKRIVDGATKIYFLRKKDKKDESLVTIEVARGNVCQVRGLMNRAPSESEKKAIAVFAEKNKFELTY